MSGRPTLIDVATRAGVHVATASRALGPATRHMVSAATARRVDAAAHELGYTPNALASALRRQQSSIVGVLVPDLTDPTFPPILRGLESVLAPRGVGLLVANTDDDADTEALALECLRARQVDALCIATARREEPVLAEIRDSGMRGVLVHHTTDEPLFPSVVPDDALGMRQAVGYLLRLGHHRVVHLGGPSTTSVGHARAVGFSDAVGHFGVGPRSCPTVPAEGVDVGVDAGRRAMRAALDLLPDLTGVVAATDLMAAGALRELTATGLSCPDDVSVIGYGDTVLSADLGPGLTTVTVPLFEMGRRAAERVLDDASTPSGRVVLPVHLTVRGSTARPAPQRR